MQQSLQADLGKSSKEVMIESLEEFGKLSEFTEMDDILSNMMAKAHESQVESTQIHEISQKRIQKELDEVSRKYGRVMTPAITQGRKAGKLETVQEEEQ